METVTDILVLHSIFLLIRLGPVLRFSRRALFKDLDEMTLRLRTSRQHPCLHRLRVVQPPVPQPSAQKVPLGGGNNLWGGHTFAPLVVLISRGDGAVQVLVPADIIPQHNLLLHKT